MKNYKIIFWSFIVLFFVVPVLKGLIAIYPEFAWFADLGYKDVFIKIFLSKYIFTSIALIVFFIFILTNIGIARYVRKKYGSTEIVYENDWSSILKQQFGVNNELDGLFGIFKNKISVYVILFFISLGSASLIGANWESIYTYFNYSLFNKVDPLFNKDLSFYFFQYPFLLTLKRFFSSMIIVSIISVLFFYINKKSIRIGQFDIFIEKHVKIHLTVLISILFGLMAIGYKLNMYNLLYTKGIVFGAGYTDAHISILGFKILIAISLLTIGLLVINIFNKGIRLPAAGISLLLFIGFITQGIIPKVIQSLIVKPNELVKERPYINYHIQSTREAYELNKVKERPFVVKYDLNSEKLSKYSDTLSNIRLFDPRPLKSTFAQLQEIRLYYDFLDVDVDRYKINGKYQQVMLSARELNPDKLPPRAQNWINKKLTYTHGYGATVIPVNSITQEGKPNFLLKDIPPIGSSDLQITRPEIYFGEMLDDYVIVNTNNPEFDFPFGDNNKFTEYKGSTGVVLSSIFKRIIFAIKYGEPKILLSQDFKKDSKILFYRNIKERVSKIAPFLMYDRDPYLVISKGKLLWIIDAYTLSNKYPYSEPFNRQFNYIRNSVKVVVDAYNGTTDFYIVSHEPVIDTFAKIFPTLFKDVSKLDQDIINHFRYPEDLFWIQAEKFGTYHMTDPVVFYNQEDLWVLPNETYDENTSPMNPYHVLLKAPGESEAAFRLMLPFTPSKKNNMIGWMSANSDYPNYGEITVFKMPKDQLIYGPVQIDAMIDQDTEISRQLTMWNQKGSKVIRGNLLVIPIENSFLYVEPLYLQATQSKFPELKRVIVAYNNNIAMETDFETALRKVFDMKADSQIIEETNAKSQLIKSEGAKISTKELINQANIIYSEAISAQQAGKWAVYGSKINELEIILKKLKNN